MRCLYPASIVFFGFNRSSLKYQSRRPGDSTVRDRLRDLPQSSDASAIGVWLLAREGHIMNHKKLYCIYHEGKADGAPMRPTKGAVGVPAPLSLPDTIT